MNNTTRTLQSVFWWLVDHQYSGLTDSLCAAVMNMLTKVRTMATFSPHCTLLSRTVLVAARYNTNSY